VTGYLVRGLSGVRLPRERVSLRVRKPAITSASRGRFYPRDEPRRLDRERIVQGCFAIAVINAWNLLNVSFRNPPPLNV
jgi:alkylhydroperoxidase family enzyme